MLPELGDTFAISPATASASLTAFLLPFAAAMLFSGTLGERWGRVRTVRTAYVVYALSCALAVLSSTWGVFLAARVLQGLSNAFTTPLIMAALAASVAPDALGRALGRYGALQAAGQTSAPLLGGLAAEVDWHLAFVGVGALALVLAVVGIPTDEGAATRPPATLRSALRPSVLRLGVVAGVGWGALAGAGFLVALRLADVFGLDAGPRGLVLTGLGVLGILTARVVGSAVDRIGARPCVVGGAVLGGVLLAAVGTVPVLWVVAALWALAGIPSQMMLVGVNTLVLGDSATRGGGAVSVVQSLRFFGASASPIALPPVYHQDPVAAFLAPAAVLVVAVPALVPRR